MFHFDRKLQQEKVDTSSGDSKKADGGKKLVSRAEESPDLGKSAHAEGDAENNGCNR